MTVEKRISRLRRAKRTRMHIRDLDVARLTVHRTGQHLYDLVTAQTQLAALAQKALAAGVDTVAFDRSGFLYHGRIKSLADAAREAGLKF